MVPLDEVNQVRILLAHACYRIQSDGNSFCGDVVLDSFNKASRDEDNILDQKYKSKYVWKYFYDDFHSLYIYTKLLTYTTVAQKPKFLSFLCIFWRKKIFIKKI